MQVLPGGDACASSPPPRAHDDAEEAGRVAQLRRLLALTVRPAPDVHRDLGDPKPPTSRFDDELGRREARLLEPEPRELRRANRTKAVRAVGDPGTADRID